MPQGVNGGDTVSPGAGAQANAIPSAHDYSAGGAASAGERKRMPLPKMLLPSRADDSAGGDLTNTAGDGGKAAHLLPPSVGTS